MYSHLLSSLERLERYDEMRRDEGRERWREGGGERDTEREKEGRMEMKGINK